MASCTVVVSSSIEPIVVAAALAEIENWPPENEFSHDDVG